MISKELNKLANTNYVGYNNFYFELNTLFTYYATLFKVSRKFIKRIFDSYLVNNW